MSAQIRTVNCLRGLAGAVGGGVLGYFTFFFLVEQGLYAMVLPGALVGLGCGLLSGIKSNTLGVACAGLALLLGVFIEWRFAPLIADTSLTYFITHLQDKKLSTLVLIALGGLMGFWFGRGREGVGLFNRRTVRR